MNILNFRNCYGCGVCSIVCPRHIIEMDFNKDGFYEPHIKDVTKCIDCGLCVDVCSYSHEGLSLKDYSIKSYAAWSNDKIVRMKCSSGGISFEVGRTLINEGYKTCGVRYNIEKKRAEHYIATTVEELISSIGSKYIQSYTVDSFKVINRKEKYLITGTPCQIDSFRRYIQKFRCEDNFVLMDFFCHGVPSMWLWYKYINEVEKKVGKITYVSWRNKFTGWHDSWAMSMDGDLTSESMNLHDSYNSLENIRRGDVYSRLSQGDPFYHLFLSDSCLGKACYEKCKFKYKCSSADIRIGDLWGKTYQDNEDGVSAAVAFTKKGDDILHRCNSTLVEHPFEVVAEGQMKVNPVCPKYSRKIKKMLREKYTTMQMIDHKLKRMERITLWRNRLKHPLRSFMNLIKK